MKIMIIGGYGVFGGRLVELLADICDLELIICGRSLSKAQAYCEAFEGKANVQPLQLDRNGISAVLSTLQPQIVVDASGPFQTYGGDCYSVIKACINQKVNYLDFADAADFVYGVSQFNEQAKSAGIFVLSGVSSFPVLTAAVLRKMALTMDVKTVHGGIAPSVYAGVGLNVMKAVLSYAGEPVKLQRAGEVGFGIGLAESMRYTVAVPGKLPLRNIRFSLVDVPDLQIIPPEQPTLTDIWMGAGPVPETLHRILNLLAKARSRFKLPSLVPFSKLFYTVLNLVKFGEHRGGMFVHAKGISKGETIEQSWHLLAEGDDGPYIPSMTIEAIIRKSLSGQHPDIGARSGANALELEDYDQLFSSRKIYTDFRQNDDSPFIFEQVLGAAYSSLPAKVQAFHKTTEASQWRGQAKVKRGNGMLVNMICACFGFPQTADNVPVNVSILPDDKGEHWIRNFDGKAFSSKQRRGVAKNEFLLVESFGVLDFSVALVIEGDRLYFVPRAWSCFGIPLPKFLLPKGRSYETEEDGMFCFNVELAAPIIGLIVSYEGSLERVNDMVNI